MWCFIHLAGLASASSASQLAADGEEAGGGDSKEDVKPSDSAVDLEGTSESAASSALRSFWTPQSVYLDKLGLTESECSHHSRGKNQEVESAFVLLCSLQSVAQLCLLLLFSVCLIVSLSSLALSFSILVFSAAFDVFCVTCCRCDFFNHVVCCVLFVVFCSQVRSLH
jgi:hypothetical protein